MLEVKNLKFSYKNKLVFDNINFSVNKGEILIVMGLNGSGKSTLLKSIAHLLKYHGAILLDNVELKNFSISERVKKISYLPQKFLGERVTVYDAIMLGRKPYIRINPSEIDKKKVNKIVNFLKLNEIANKYCDEISGGELQKVFIGRALAQEPKLLLLDEPVNHLDIYNQIEVMNMIRKIVKELNLIGIIVLHDLNTALKYGDKFLFLKKGKIISFGDKTIINEDSLKKIFNLNLKIQKINEFLFIIPKN